MSDCENDSDNELLFKRPVKSGYCACQDEIAFHVKLPGIVEIVKGYHCDIYSRNTIIDLFRRSMLEFGVVSSQHRRYTYWTCMQGEWTNRAYRTIWGGDDACVVQISMGKKNGGVFTLRRSASLKPFVFMNFANTMEALLDLLSLENRAAIQGNALWPHSFIDTHSGLVNLACDKALYCIIGWLRKEPREYVCEHEICETPRVISKNSDEKYRYIKPRQRARK